MIVMAAMASDRVEDCAGLAMRGIFKHDHNLNKTFFICESLNKMLFCFSVTFVNGNDIDNNIRQINLLNQ